MIIGVVTPHCQAVIELVVRGPQPVQQTTQAVIDTGFTDYLTLPPNLIALLGLPYGGSLRVTLADRSEVDLNLYLCHVLWDGQWLQVAVLSADGEPLVGMSLLHGVDLRVQVVDGGTVTIDRLRGTALPQPMPRSP